MSERERWIVYPLLFLALGASLRDKLFNITTSKSIRCQELTVIDEDPLGMREGRVLAQIGRTENTSPADASKGYLYVDGQIEARGAVVARQYGVRDLPFAPGTLMLISTEFWQALEQAFRQSHPPGTKRVEPQPPSDAPVENSVPANEPQ